MERKWSLYPIEHRDLWDLYKKHVSLFWTVEEIDLSRDYADFQEKLTPPAQEFLKNTLGFFAVGDGVVLQNVLTNFFSEIEIPEARQFYAVQAFSEAIHAEMYSLILQTVIRDEKERLRIFHLVESSPTLAKKIDWMKKYLDPSIPLPLRLVAYACTEGIAFSSSFASIFWLRTQNVCPGVCSSNNFIARDEGLHASMACMLFKKLGGYAEDEVMTIIKEAVDLEIDFAREGLRISLLGINSDDMATYIKLVGDRLLVDLGFDKIYNVTNPLDFMEWISMEGKTNFFEHRNDRYVKRDTANIFSTDEEF